MPCDIYESHFEKKSWVTTNIINYETSYSPVAEFIEV